jgi:hypothetical protein
VVAGVFRNMDWRDVSEPGVRGPLALKLPQGSVTLILRPREAGSKIDQLRLTPLPE